MTGLNKFYRNHHFIKKSICSQLVWIVCFLQVDFFLRPWFDFVQTKRRQIRLHGLFRKKKPILGTAAAMENLAYSSWFQSELIFQGLQAHIFWSCDSILAGVMFFCWSENGIFQIILFCPQNPTSTNITLSLMQQKYTDKLLVHTGNESLSSFAKLS